MIAQDDTALAAAALEHLRAVVAIDSASDEASPTIPSTPGQARLAEFLDGWFSRHGARVQRDAHANVIAWLAGRGERAGDPPLALLVHLDTARGTQPLTELVVRSAWDGTALQYPGNQRLVVDVATYPALQRYLGQDVVHGDGVAPFGLDDKLGLTHLMSLARVLFENPAIPHPPLLLVGRPDEEIGRDQALIALAAQLAERGVRTAWTVDGLDPYEVNVENFEAAAAHVHFARGDRSAERRLVVYLAGVNSHGATARAEGHRPATRLAAEVLELVDSWGWGEHVHADGFATDPDRDCDALVGFALSGPEASVTLQAALDEVVSEHRSRGAGWRAVSAGSLAGDGGAADELLRWVAGFLASDPGFVLSAEDSEGRQGNSQPWRAVPGPGGLRLDVRLRDFDRDGLQERKAHVRRHAGQRAVAIEDQYSNMGPRLTDPGLRDRPIAAAARLGLSAVVQPIRGGTGVDPFLDAGVQVGNLGTGYFAPESEKEFTTLQCLAGHARWLVELVSAPPE